jgi:hypothetical protein
MRFDPSDENYLKSKKAVIIFEDGDAEMWCYWWEQLNELYQHIQLKKADQGSCGFAS